MKGNIHISIWASFFFFPFPLWLPQPAFVWRVRQSFFVNYQNMWKKWTRSASKHSKLFAEWGYTTIDLSIKGLWLPKEKHKCGNERERTYKYMGIFFPFPLWLPQPAFVWRVRQSFFVNIKCEKKWTRSASKHSTIICWKGVYYYWLINKRTLVATTSFRLVGWYIFSFFVNFQLSEVQKWTSIAKHYVNKKPFRYMKHSLKKALKRQCRLQANNLKGQCYLYNK